jgi:hypothetical protein
MRATNPWRMLELVDPRRGHRTKWTPVSNMKQEGWCDGVRHIQINLCQKQIFNEENVMRTEGRSGAEI